MRRRIILLGFVLASFSLAAQQSGELQLSLQQAQNYAIENNKSLRNVRTDVAISKQKFWQTVAQGLPQASATVDYTNFFNYEIEFGMGGSDNPPTIDYTKLDDGDWQILSFLQQSMGSGSTTIQMKNSSSAKLQVTQLIFSGQYITGIQMAKVAQILTQMNVEKTELDIRESVISTYYMGLLTQKSLELIDANLENLNQTLTQTKAMFAAGMIEENRCGSIGDVDYNARKLASSLLRNLELNNNLMKFILGIDGDVRIVLTDTFEQVLESVNVLICCLQNLTHRQYYNTDDGQANGGYREIVDMEKWTYAPSIVGVYSHNEKLVTTDFDMNPKNLFSITCRFRFFRRD
jgi:hypothetical protein